ncbi:hypothetical protein CEE37_06815 [candidate division LCP-89 bacterium B3_LCP]|uniref:Uncharacterized protein n=1 Tax=candidate division LCP-89 bacterium B3_LCP TaxID=2012998 RepID=A0A532V0K0_UNCL8|nr:MAG: hypothetical protein CEE37_06815 [candidate division LCP-89 bacterium B3_LCP]
MNFDSNHYVSILKVKQGEKKALQSISPPLKSYLTPMLEFVERKSGSIDDHLNTAFNDLAESVQGYSRCFIDLLELASDGPQVAKNILERAGKERIVFTPVTGISRTADVAAVLNHRTNGIAIRLTRQDFEEGSLRQNLKKFINHNILSVEETDLVVDIGSVEDLIEHGVKHLAEAFLAEVPDPQLWRTFTITGSSFPQSMGVVDRHSFKNVARLEWKVWRNSLYANRLKLNRLPTFSDCAIQNPIGVEGFDFRIHQVSPSIRYTSGEDWLLIKGESNSRVLPSTQFPALASRLVYGNLSDQFRGESHCEGCAMVKKAADGVKGFGSATKWRLIGTIHHITTVVEELASLPSP